MVRFSICEAEMSNIPWRSCCKSGCKRASIRLRQMDKTVYRRCPLW